MRLDGLLTPKDVAADLDVSYVTVINYLKQGHIEGFKVGGQWRIKPSELKRFKEQGNRSEEVLK